MCDVSIFSTRDLRIRIYIEVKINDDKRSLSILFKREGEMSNFFLARPVRLSIRSLYIRIAHLKRTCCWCRACTTRKSAERCTVHSAAIVINIRVLRAFLEPIVVDPAYVKRGFYQRGASGSAAFYPPSRSFFCVVSLSPFPPSERK